MFSESVFSQAKGLMEHALEEDEFFSLSAQLLKKYHNALQEAGFTEEQATHIVASQGSGIGAN